MIYRKTQSSGTGASVCQGSVQQTVDESPEVVFAGPVADDAYAVRLAVRGNAQKKGRRFSVFAHRLSSYFASYIGLLSGKLFAVHAQCGLLPKPRTCHVGNMLPELPYGHLRERLYGSLARLGASSENIVVHRIGCHVEFL